MSNEDATLRMLSHAITGVRIELERLQGLKGAVADEKLAAALDKIGHLVVEFQATVAAIKARRESAVIGGGA